MRFSAAIAVLLLSVTYGKAQIGDVIELPIQVQQNIHGIDITVIIEKIIVNNKGAFMKATVVIPGPENNTVLYFKADIPLDIDEGYKDVFLNSFKELSIEEQWYIQKFMSPCGERYRWNSNVDLVNFQKILF